LEKERTNLAVNFDFGGAPFWSLRAEEALANLEASPEGLSGDEALKRLRVFGFNKVADRDRRSVFGLLLRQFQSPLVLILIFGACVSLLLREWIDASVILAIVLGSAVLGFYHEYRASDAVAKLRARLALSARALRDGVAEKVPVSSLVPGDIILLSAGDLIPADCLVLEADDFLVAEASLTGESFPVEKRPGVAAADATLQARTNAVFMGASVRSGSARALVCATGARTAFGAIAARLQQREPETNFARGVRRFGEMLVRVMIVIVLFVLTVNQLLGRPIEQSLLYAVALAVGLSPELLPAIVSVTLAAGAAHLAKSGVIVRRLEAIENLGGMDVLCTDKTGTLTEGVVTLADAVDASGRSSPDVRRLAFLNAVFETGIDNPLDTAIRAAGERDGLWAESFRKIDEIPYDFVRRRLTVVVEDRADPGLHRVIIKGAFASVAPICDTIVDAGIVNQLDAEARKRLEAFLRAQGESGVRVLALAERQTPAKPRYDIEDEAGLTFLGFLLFRDPPKADAEKTVRDLAALGVSAKVITGDNRYVTAHLAGAIGLDPKAMLTGEELASMKDEALWHRAPRTDLFVEIDPQQKERIVRALQRTGLSVGYLGDGINDAPALRAADVGISVDDAVDVARESADIVLLKPDLGVLRQGVMDGRKTFANTLKYIYITTSANFGNMVSMAIATPLLPFLPLLPKQILLNNFLSDLPSAAISTDSVDSDQIARPQEWDVKRVERFMIVFGLISSCFDLLTFAMLIWVFRADEGVFQTGWFVVSLLTELAVLLVLRTHGFALASRPSPLLLRSTIAVAAAALAIPFLGGVSGVFGFEPLTAPQLGALLAIVVLYAATTEAAKLWFHRRAIGSIRQAKGPRAEMSQPR
jgi:Mg2+-importing ATPase